ncbi:hypothetical protein KSS87_016910, partial [Heliosperma pusillum]
MSFYSLSPPPLPFLHHIKIFKFIGLMSKIAVKSEDPYLSRSRSWGRKRMLSFYIYIYIYSRCIFELLLGDVTN